MDKTQCCIKHLVWYVCCFNICNTGHNPPKKSQNVAIKAFYLYGQGQLRWGAGGARIALHTELFPSLLSAEEAFSSIVDSLV